MDKEKIGSEKAAAGTQSIERAVALLRALAQLKHDGGSVAELAVATALERTTAHRILKCLAHEGLLQYSSQSRRYFLGSLAYEIGLAASGRIKLRKICEAALTRIAEQTGDTVFLMERERHDSVCIDRAEGHYPVKTLLVEVGSRRPLGIGAGSLAMLGAMAPDEAEAIIEHNADRYADFPGVSLRGLRCELQATRDSGRVSTAVTGIKDVHSVSVALRGSAGQPIGALSIAAVKSRMSAGRQLELLDILTRESSAITRLLADM